MSEAMRPIDYTCPTCSVLPEQKCRISAEDKRAGVKAWHPERVRLARQSPTAANLRSARRASESPVPFASDRVVFIWDAGTRTSATHLKFANTVADKIKLLSRPRKVYAVWPGGDRSDLFYIDDRRAVLNFLRGHPPVMTNARPEEFG